MGLNEENNKSMVGSTIYSMASLLTVIINLSLGIFVIFSNGKSTVNRVFALLMLATSVWAFGLYFHVTSTHQITALFWGRFLHYGSIFIPPIFFHFILSVLNIDKRERGKISFAYLCAAFFLFLNGFTGLLVKGVSQKGLFFYLNDVGLFYPLYIFYFVFFFNYAYYFIFKEYPKLSGFKQNQVLYVFAASLLGIIGSTTSYLAIYNVGGTSHYPLMFLVSFYNIATALAITKAELMDIRVVIGRSLAYGMVGAVMLGSFAAFFLLPIPKLTLFFISATSVLIWAWSAHRLREFIQTPLVEKWITNWYDPEKLFNHIALKLMSVIDRKGAFQITADELKNTIKIKNIDILMGDETPKTDEIKRSGKTMEIPFSSSQGIEGAIRLSEKISEDPYDEKDLRLFQTLQVQLLAILDRIRPYEEIKKELESVQLQLERSQRLASLGTLIAGVTHEIRNPMTVIRGEVETLFNRQRDEAFLKRSQQAILESVDRVESIIEGMLGIAREKPRKRDLDVDICELINKSLTFFHFDRIQLVKNLNPVPLLKGNPDELREVFINLIQNAIEAMPAGGILTLTSKTEDGQTIIELSDTGKGIPPEIREKIFDPFFSTRHEGVGLGLSIAYRIIREHGGTITVGSEVDKGTTFRISF